jgi:PAS domain S-box-containing protein
MFLFEELSLVAKSWRLILDPALLSILIFPFFYFMVYRPFKNKIIEQERTNEALQKSLKELADYKYALDESSIVAITDPKGIIKHVNDNFCKISKYSPEELIGQDHRLLSSGYHSGDFFRNLWETIESGKIWKGEVKNKAGDGTFHWLDTAIIPFLNEQGKPFQYLTIRADITERKKAELALAKLNNELEQTVIERTEALQKSELHYRSLFENMIEGFAYCKMVYEDGKPTDFIYLNVNAAFENLTGLKNVVGKKVTEVIPGIRKDSPELFATYNRVALTGKPERFEVYLASIDMWFYVSVYSSQREYFIAVFDVITERKRTEEAQNLFRTLIDNSNDAVEVIDPLSGRFLDANKKAWSGLGYTREEFLTLSVPDIDTMVNSSLFAQLQVELRKSGFLLWEGIHQRKDGSTFPVEVNVRLIHLEKEYIVTVARDITERKKAEEKLRKSEDFIQGILLSLITQVGVIDETGTLIATNRAWEDFSKKLKDKRQPTLVRLPQGSNCLEAYKKAAAEENEFAAQTLKGIYSVFNKETDFFELRYPCYAGVEEHWFLLRVMNFESETPKVVMTHTDITEVINAGILVEQSESNLKQVMDNSSEMIWSMDREHHLIIFNKSFYYEYLTFFGKPPVTGIIHYKGFDPEGEAIWKSKIEETLTGHNVEFEQTYKINDQLKHIDIFLYPVRVDNSVEGVTCFVMNITKRKNMEQEQEESYQAIRMLTEHLQNVREEERTSIAREIHDELGQQLTVLKMDVSWLNKKVGTENNAVREKIKDLLGMLDNTIKTVRKISTQLRPSILDDLGLVAAIELHLKEFEEKSGIRTLFTESKTELQFTDPLKNALFRIFQESLTNVARHSGAKKVKVKLEKKNKEIVLLIKDNGVGFDERKAAVKKTLGVLGMKERAAGIGGQYLISGKPGKGTTILVTVPLHDS